MPLRHLSPRHFVLRLPTCQESRPHVEIIWVHVGCFFIGGVCFASMSVGELRGVLLERLK